MSKNHIYEVAAVVVTTGFQNGSLPMIEEQVKSSDDVQASENFDFTTNTIMLRADEKKPEPDLAKAVMDLKKENDLFVQSVLPKALQLEEKEPTLDFVIKKSDHSTYSFKDIGIAEKIGVHVSRKDEDDVVVSRVQKSAYDDIVKNLQKKIAEKEKTYNKEFGVQFSRKSEPTKLPFAVEDFVPGESIKGGMCQVLKMKNKQTDGFYFRLWVGEKPTVTLNIAEHGDEIVVFLVDNTSKKNTVTYYFDLCSKNSQFETYQTLYKTAENAWEKSKSAQDEEPAVSPTASQSDESEDGKPKAEAEDVAKSQKVTKGTKTLKTSHDPKDVETKDVEDDEEENDEEATDKDSKQDNSLVWKVLLGGLSVTVLVGCSLVVLYNQGSFQQKPADQPSAPTVVFAPVTVKRSAKKKPADKKQQSKQQSNRQRA